MNANIFLIIACLSLGIILRKNSRFSNVSHAFNSFVIWVSLPALILVQIPAFLKTHTWSTDFWIPVSMPWITILLSLIIFSQIGRHLRWKHTKTGAVILTAGLGNTSFVGFPLLESYIGPQAISIGIILDQLGSFLVLSTFGIIIASFMGSGTRPNVTKIAHRVLTFPPFIALIFAFLWSLVGNPGTSFFSPAFEKLGATLVPIALFSVGLRLKLSTKIFQKHWKVLCLGLGFKLIFIPAFFLFLYVGIFQARNFITYVTIIESAMAPMTTAAIIAEEFGLDSELASLMLGIGIPISLLTVYLWSRLPFWQTF